MSHINTKTFLKIKQFEKQNTTVDQQDKMTSVRFG